MAQPTEAIRLAQASDWKGLQRLIDRVPECARERDEYGMLPIHWVCTESCVPLALLDKLLCVYPEGVRTKNEVHLLPLHIAIRAHATPSRLKRLLAAYPDAVHDVLPDGLSVLGLADKSQLGRESRKLLVNALKEDEGRGSNDHESPEQDDEDNSDNEHHSQRQSDRKSGHDGNPKDAPHHENKYHLLPTKGTPSPALDGDGHPPRRYTNSTSSVNSAPLPMTAPIGGADGQRSKQLQGPFHRKHSLDYHRATAAASAARQHHENFAKRSRNQLHTRSAVVSGERSGRHQSLPTIPSFENFQFASPPTSMRTQHDMYHDRSSEEDESEHARRRIHLFSGYGRGRSHGDMDRDSGGVHDTDGGHFESPPEWKRDDECSICRASFGMFKHRHHCRNCGKSICSQHSADRKITMTGTNNGVTNGDGATTASANYAMQRAMAKEKMETLMLQAQVNELRHVVSSQKKQLEQLAQTNIQMQQQILEQEELKAETMLLITQLMTRVSVLEMQKVDERQPDSFTT
uniref:FYVE-type domain-containing protein n=1 Tax=Globisporangium ultimum (strain ATCC 200006 / CBS 805.95 / DAOM BR144) TaxID=431595 RepID=K3WAK4_GLOUD